MITNFVVVGLVYRLAVNRHYIKHWLVDLMMKKKKNKTKTKLSKKERKKRNAPSEDRTHDLQIALFQ